MRLVLLLILIFNFVKSDDNLELIHVIFRHGDRTPEKHHLYPTDPNLNKTWNFPLGQHTALGKTKLEALGKFLKQRYRDFLVEYTPNSIYTRSTDVNRTQQALQIVLNAIFSENGTFRKYPALHRKWINDRLLGQTFRNCPRYKKIYFDYLNSTKALALYGQYEKTRNVIRKYAQIEPTSKAVWELFFTLQMELENNMTIPQWTQKVFPEPMRQIVHLEYESRSFSDEMKRLSSGFLFRKIVQDTRRNMRDPLKPKKMFLYSAHDFTIAYMLKFLQVPYPTHVPSYGSTIMIEIHNVNEQRIVKVYYHDYMSQSPKLLRIPKCPHFCKLERFVKLYKHLIPKSKLECLNKK